MGLLIVFLPAYFPHDPHPAWAFYDALPDPIGWLMVVTGVRLLRGHLDVDVLVWLGWVAFAVSVPLWFPQVNHLLVPEYNHSIDVSFQWFLSLPQTVFSLLLARAVGRAGEDQQAGPREVAAVPCADEHPVQDEDDTGEGLGEGGDEEHRHQQRPHGRVGGEQRSQPG